MAPERGEGPGEETGVVPAHDTTPFNSSEAMLHIKEGDGAVEAVLERSEDDDLTSLTWLQDKNLLKGINLRNSVAVKQESPTSDYTEDSPSEQSESTCSSVNSCSPVPQNNAKNKHPHHIPYDPKIHVTSKPPYSFSCLIFMSIENSKGKALPVKEIYTWILENFPYYRNAPTGWKNSVRHNLSLNKCFRKVDKAPNLGKGSLWMVDPVFRPNLVQALMKAPYHPYTNVDKGASTPIKEDISPLPPNDNNESGIDYTSQDELDDVDAATAMLVLKHGPHASLHLTQRRDEYHKRHRMSLLSSIPNGVKTSKPAEEDNLSATRPTEDHTYSAESGLEITSADEAFADGSDSNSSWSMTHGMYENDPEERRKTVEGADALLNLAGITTTPLLDPCEPPLKKPRTAIFPKSNHRLFTLNNNTIMPSKLRRKPACPQKVQIKSKR